MVVKSLRFPENRICGIRTTDIIVFVNLIGLLLRTYFEQQPLTRFRRDCIMGIELTHYDITS